MAVGAHLPGDHDLVFVIVAWRLVEIVVIAECHRHSCFCYPGLTLLVHQVQRAASAHLHVSLRLHMMQPRFARDGLQVMSCNTARKSLSALFKLLLARHLWSRDNESHRIKLLDAQNEAQRVQDIGLAGAVEPRDGIEGPVKLADDSTPGVGLEAVDRDLFDTHIDTMIARMRQADSRHAASSRGAHAGLSADRC